MAVTNTIKATKFQLKYANNKGSYTFSDLKNSGTTDDKILATAQAFASVQESSTEKIYKLIDNKLEKTQA
jgi:hypothetical protein